MKYFRVKHGYGADDFISIDESELPMALRAQITGKVGVFKEGSISGNHIMSITPDYQREMGFHRDYKLQGEDYREMRGLVDEYRSFIELATTQVHAQLGGGNMRLSTGALDK